MAVLVFSILVVFIWIGGSIYLTYSSSALPDSETAITVVALEPKIDTVPLEILEQRKWWTDQELQTFPLSIELEKEIQ